MSAVITKSCHGELVQLRHSFSEGGPLPWVLHSVGEESVRARHRVERKLCDAAVGLGARDVVNVLAHVVPVGHVEQR